MRWLRRWLLFLIAATLLALWLLQPERAGRLLLWQAGNALGLKISAGTIDYQLRGTPHLDLHDVVAQRPGDGAPLLRAKRLFVSLPWRTLRSLGDELRVQRITLDGPVLHLPALQRWLATRPASKTRLPTLIHGLHLRDGRVDNDDWRIDQLTIDIPNLQPRQRLRMHVQGRYLAPPLAMPVDLAVSLVTPQRLLDGQRAGIAGIGKMHLQDARWQAPMQIFLAGPLRIGKDSALLQPAKLGIAGHYQNASTRLPFRLGLHGPMAFNNASWRFVPATVVLAGDGKLLPNAQARGSVTLGLRLRLQLDGQLAGWPMGWPALPAPLAGSTSPLPFALRYQGALAFSDAATLSLRRDATTFDAHFRLPEILAWLDAGATSSPLPPLAGTLATPRLELDGTTLEGVKIEVSDL
jgi:hypothetical protein